MTALHLAFHNTQEQWFELHSTVIKGSIPSIISRSEKCPGWLSKTRSLKTSMAVYSFLINSLDTTIKDVLRPGRGNGDDSAVAGKPESPLKETIDTSGNKYYCVSKVLPDLFFNLNSQIAQASEIGKISSVG